MRFNAAAFPRINFLIVSMFAMHAAGCSAGDDAAAQAAPRAGAFAVVELFTSEGCSSCPPADALLGEIAQDAQRSGASIFPIAFHIDYWDGLGWKDRFSLAAATGRQQRYATALGSDVYTPQMVVNGHVQFVGSDRDAYRRAVTQALATPPASHLTLELAKADGPNLSITYKSSDAPAGSVLNLVVVQRSASTEVPRGENAGHTLHHTNIARSISTISLDAPTGTETLKLPSELAAKDALVIGYIQDPKTLQILAAAKADLMQ